MCETSNTLETLGFEAEGLRPTRDKVDEKSDYLEILRKINKISVFAYFCLEAALNDNIVPLHGSLFRQTEERGGRRERSALRV